MADALIGVLLVFYITKSLTCIGALSFFKIFSDTSWFFKSTWSSDIGLAETGKEQKASGSRHDIFSL